MTHYTRFEQIPLFTYGLIMADPAWLFDNWSKRGEHKNATAHYDCMPLEEIKALRVQDIASKDTVLVLWATNPMLRQAFEVMDAWGFPFITAGTWVKLTKNEKIAFGTGYVLRSANEPFLIGKLGNPDTARNVRTVVAERREHSRKPDAAYDHFEMLVSSGMRKIELFSRQAREGWDTFDKNEPVFDAVAG